MPCFPGTVKGGQDRSQRLLVYALGVVFHSRDPTVFGKARVKGYAGGEIGEPDRFRDEVVGSREKQVSGKIRVFLDG
jgi:hypothetical protein